MESHGLLQRQSCNRLCDASSKDYFMWGHDYIMALLLYSSEPLCVYEEGSLNIPHEIIQVSAFLIKWVKNWKETQENKTSPTRNGAQKTARRDAEEPCLEGGGLLCCTVALTPSQVLHTFTSCLQLSFHRQTHQSHHIKAFLAVSDAVFSLQSSQIKGWREITCIRDSPMTGDAGLSPFLVRDS